jgi:MFS family permease
MLVTTRGLTPAVAGLTLTFGAVGWFSGSWVQGRRRLPVSRPTLLALGCLTVGIAVLVLVVTPRPQVPIWLIAPLWVVAGFGMGLGMSGTSVLTLRLSAPGEEGRNSAGLQLGDNVGAVVGLGVAGAIFAALHQPDGDDSAVFSLIWAILGVVGLLSAVMALRVRRRA